MCVPCVRSQADVTAGISRSVTLLWCKECGRYLQPPRHWVKADPESRELLTFCVKRLRGLNTRAGGGGGGAAGSVRLVDAAFVWTEPHSRRLKVKLTVQGEVLSGAVLQQTFVVEYVIETHMCPDCARRAANPDTWTACVQVRQHVAHKRTFLFLEQVILRHGAADACVTVRDINEGVDFFFGNRAHAQRFVDFLQGAVPVRYRADKQLVSHDIHTSSYNYKYTFSVEIAPPCRDDLVCLPHRTSQALGGLGPLALVTRVGGGITVTDPTTARSVTLDAPSYWRSPFKALFTSRQLVEYVVLDVEEEQQGRYSGGASVAASLVAGGGKGGGSSRLCGGSGTPAAAAAPSTVAGSAYGPGTVATSTARYATAELQLARSSDFGRNDTTFFARTHLGRLLKPGDIALGYDLAGSNATSLDYDALVARGGRVPDVVLVRKSYEDKRARRRQRRAAGASGAGGSRPWQLKRLPMEVADEGAGPRGRNEAAEAADRERFLEELEEDPDMRARVNLYRAPGGEEAAAAGGGAGARSAAARGPRPLPGIGEEEDDDAALDTEDDDDDDDVPQVPLDELLDDLEALELDERGAVVRPGGGGRGGGAAMEE
jgi:nonsense-mediated mRNA decay protein 3